MTQITIHLVHWHPGLYHAGVSHRGTLLWQFRLISSGDAVLGRRLYYSPKAAERAGWDWIVQERGEAHPVPTQATE